MNNSGQEIEVELIGLPLFEQLEQEWRELETHSDASFFTSWSWIGCWLNCLPKYIQPRLLRISNGNKVLGLGLLVSSHFRRHRILPVNGLFLNTTGDPLYDVITIEYNGFLVDRSFQSLITPRLYEHLVSIHDCWDEFQLNGIVGLSGSLIPTLKEVCVKRRQRNSYYVDLEEVRQANGGYLSLLGQNTRYNIRRSIKEYTKHGPLKLIVAENIDEALTFFSGLKQLHQTYWRSRGMPGAFGNDFFESFHNRIIRTGFSKGEIQLICVNAGDRIIGYLYNFIHRGHVYNYQSGFDYSICEKKNRPGLVTHSLAVEHNATLGHDIYDLMVGDSDYKLALSLHTFEMEWIILQRCQLKFKVEEGLRKIKKKVTYFKKYNNSN